MTNTEEVNKGIYFSYPCRRHSCSVVNIPAPCVNKMISHIQDVESKIHEHLKRFETSFEEWSRTSSTKDLKEDWSIATPVKEVKPKEERDERCPELKQEMETLLSEAIQLIKSLETDRAEAEEALKRQRLRKKKINMTIDSWSIWKLQELPLAVEKEHEAYLRDIVELRWHLEDKVSQLEQIEGQKRKLEEANAKIQADVDYMQKHGPLLDSKRNQELEVLKELYQKKTEVMDLYRQVHGELEEALEKLENIKLKTKQIKEEMEEGICNDEMNIKSYKREIENLKDLYLHYVSSIQNIHVTIEENEVAVTEVLKETRSSSKELSSLSRTQEELKRIFDQLTWKQKNYEKQYLEAFNDFYTAKKIWNVELSNITKDFTDISIACSQLTQENKKLESEIDSIKEQMSESVRKKAEYESEIQKLLRMKTKNDDFLKQLYKKAYHISALFHLTKHKTEELEDKIAEGRRKFKGREEFLKRLIRDEVATGMMIQKRRYSIQEAQIIERQELVKKKAIYALALAEIEEPLLQLEGDAVRIRTIYKEHSDTLHDILERQKHVRKEVDKTKKNLRRKGKKTREALTETEGKRSMIFKEIESTKSKTIIFYKKIDELNLELKEKEEEKKRFDEILENLKDKFLTIRFKMEHAQAVFDHYIEEKRKCQERISDEGQRFRMLLDKRQKTLEETEDYLLEENLRLAQESQKAQATFLKEKNNYFDSYDKQLALVASVRNMKELCQLQRRIRTLWQEHFKLVVLFSQTRLANFQTDSQESIQKILAVQEESSSLIQHILDFFQTLTDGPCKNDG
ncbi:coiled-coil domain-containing protein 178 [Cynocephalus volans]|uniref:coiled-coil domain-containing protein 178 n=1 Tax=Cynocephalus volans TaxID=110931 RepID=UPI002FC9B112